MKLVKKAARIRRHKRVRGKVAGTPARPRLAVYRSLKHIYAQLIDDVAGNTLVAASTNEPAFKEKVTDAVKGWNITGAESVGTMIAERAKAAGIVDVVFDRGGNPYHGRVKALADGARKGGLNF
jgi:large subunit ribosomal protein L18